MSSKNKSKSQITLSLLALLAILLVAVGMTYSWIEGGTTYSLATETDGDVKTNGAIPENVSYSGVVTLSPSSSATLNLTDYDETSNQHQSLYFSPVSSADGENFFFPIGVDSTGNNIYRASNTNDIGTKFISFDFDVKAASKCYLAFNTKPVITATKGGASLDTSAFRIMLTDGTTRYIFSTADTAQTNAVITNLDGSTGTLTTKTVSNYQLDTYTKNRLFQFDANAAGNIKVAVWLDSGADEELLNNLYGSDVSVNLQLVVAEPKYFIDFDAVTYTNDGVKESNGFKGGSITVSSVKHESKFTHSIVEGSSFTARAVAAENYEFVGWYSDAECTNRITTSVYLTQTPASDTAYYAKFQEKPKYTVTVGTYTVPSGTGGTVTVNGSGTTYEGYQDSTTTIKATAASGYTFLGWYTDSTCSGTRYSTSASVEVEIGSANITYYAKFAKNYTVNIYTRTDGATGGAGGYVNVNATPSAASASFVTYYGNTVRLYALANAGYELKDISDSAGNSLGTGYPTSVTVNADATYYADFEKLPASTTTIYVEKRSGYSIYSIWAYQKVGTTTTHYSGDEWPGESATLDSTTGYYKYTFTTTDTGTFNVVISNNGGSQYPATGVEGLEGTLGGTYLFTADNQLVEFDPADMITVNVSATPSSYGTVTVNGSSSAKVLSGDSVTLNATPKSGYKFVGWYTNSACTTTIGSTYATASQTVTVTGTAGSTITYYAKFEEETAYTIDVGVIYYLMDNSTVTQVYYWCDDGTSGTINLSSLTATTKNYSVGSSYWSGAAQKFYCYTIEVPENITGIKFKSASAWYGSDVTSFADGKIDLIFEYGNSYINYRTTK